MTHSYCKNWWLYRKTQKQRWTFFSVLYSLWPSFRVKRLIIETSYWYISLYIFHLMAYLNESDNSKTSTFFDPVTVGTMWASTLNRTEPNRKPNRTGARFTVRFGVKIPRFGVKPNRNRKTQTVNRNFTNFPKIVKNCEKFFRNGFFTSKFLHPRHKFGLKYWLL